MWHFAGTGCSLSSKLVISLCLGFMLTQGNCMNLYISVSLVLQRANLLPKPVQIMQNTTVDHRLTHQAAQCNWSVFVQDMPGKTQAIHLV